VVLFPDRLPKPKPVAAAWLEKVRADPRMKGQADALALAAALGPFIQDNGSGELPSACDMARLAKLTEDGAIEAVNQLIYWGFLAIKFRPKITFSTPFFLPPRPISGQHD